MLYITSLSTRQACQRQCRRHLHGNMLLSDVGSLHLVIVLHSRRIGTRISRVTPLYDFEIRFDSINFSQNVFVKAHIVLKPENSKRNDRDDAIKQFVLFN